MKRSKGTSKTTRLRKVSCPDCGAIARISRGCMASGIPLCGTPDCPSHSQTMQPDDPADMIEVGLLDIDTLPRPLRTEICHRMGWQDMIVRTNRAQAEGFRAGVKRPRVAEAMPF